MRLWLTEHWEFVVGTAIGIAGLVVAVVTIIYQRQPKQLDYEVRSDIKLLGPHNKGLREKLQMECAGVPMKIPAW